MKIISLIKYLISKISMAATLVNININRKSAICAMDGKKVVGILLFSVKQNMLCCMAVHPEYRKMHIASEMVLEMLNNLDRKKDIIVDTFREDDPKGQAPRAFYKKLGFEEGELHGNMNYPEQRFILRPASNTVPGRKE